MALPFVRVMLSHSNGITDVVSIVTVRLPMRPPSRKLEYVLVSVMLPGTIDCSVVKSVVDMGEDSFIMDDVGRNGERGGVRIGDTSLRSLVVVLMGV